MFSMDFKTLKHFIIYLFIVYFISNDIIEAVGLICMQHNQTNKFYNKIPTERSN